MAEVDTRSRPWRFRFVLCSSVQGFISTFVIDTMRGLSTPADRRRASLAAAVFVAASLLLSCANAQQTTNATQTPRAIVVGAGLAGIAAARELVDAGLTDVLLLEARDRPGGRLHSVNTSAGPVDLGAMWIHEATPSNPLYQLATETLGLGLSPVVQYASGQVFDAEGRPANMAYYATTFIGWNTQLLSNITRLRSLEAAAHNSSTTTTNSSSNSSTGAPQDIPFSQLFNDWVSSNEGRWAPQQVAIANALMTINVQNLLSGDVTRVSTLRYGDAKTLPAIDVHIKEGFDEIARQLLPGLNVSYDTVVTNISQAGESVTVTTGNGTQLTADYVIVTVPLGVLKQGSIGFEPQLPADKQAAIRDMGMGVLDKVVLVFRPQDVFWNRNIDFIINLNTPDDLSGRWTSWLSYQRLLGMPVLVALNAADTAMDVSALTDEQAVAEAMEVLTRAYGNSSSPLPAPVETHVTRWGRDPLAFGAYSYYVTGNPKNITGVLAAPHGRVLFAGEATSDNKATVLGALLSGRREAQRVLNMTAAAP